ncbi:MAG TPA: AfsR/SARP family transcriptional regulator [Streptosporangiaceae bacterium]|nr:AfsR/SARP family transcriptional regulator [Streptosporangiaceae bacterium]
MPYRLLGPLEVCTAERWAAIGAPKWRALLAVLLLSPARMVPVGVLVDELWPDDPPQGARKLVSGYVSKLRRVIGDPTGQVLRTRPEGYLMTVQPAEVDIGRFEELAATGRAAMRQGRAGEAVALLTEAAGLWRGAALADVPTGPLVTAERARLEEMRLSTAELRAEAQLACGQYTEVIADLRSLTAQHRLREHLRALLVRALYAAGRRGEALAEYSDVRAVLATELGVAPGAELQGLHHRILAQDRHDQHDQGRLLAALEHLSQAMAICRELAGTDSPAIAASVLTRVAGDVGLEDHVLSRLRAVQ